MEDETAKVVSSYTYYVSETAKIGKNTEIQQGAIIEDDAVIGDHCFVGCYAVISEGSVLEDNVYVGARSLFISTKKIDHRRKYETELSGPHVGYGARIASGAILLPGVKIGKNALVGIGALVAHDVPEREIYFGIPAKKRGNVPDEECVDEPMKAKKKAAKK